ncbi:MAG TPA: endonuclease III [Actinomycetota bacterium]|nr:endonuclease III [Actinomycetota bacterium]
MSRRERARTSPGPELVREIHRRLRRAYGPLDPPRGLDPLEELVLTILSQNTSDANSGRAFAALRRRFPTWEALAAAPEAAVVEAIRPGGLANTKAPRIQAILREIERREGRLDLSWMAGASDEEVTAYLLSLPGVGPKTAACVLAFSLGRPALPVDTHVHRVAARLGLLEPRATSMRAHETLAALVSPRLRVSFHVALIRHGRSLCRAGRPLCERCPLLDLCPAGQRLVGGIPPRMDSSRGPAAADTPG